MGARVLVIDDSPDYRRLLCELGASKGWRMRTASSGAEGFAAARAEVPELIVTDIALGDTDGLSLCERLRADPSLCRVPILMITGTYRLEEDRLRGLSSGADAYLTKPFDVHEFLALAEKLLSP